MTATFDPHDRTSWYFGQMSRQDATDLLMGERDGGVFLVRDSTTIHGDYVLCVRRQSTSTPGLHCTLQRSGQISSLIIEIFFPDWPSLKQFGPLTGHFLNLDPLARPRGTRYYRTVADGSQPPHTLQRSGQISSLITLAPKKHCDYWWTAKELMKQKGRMIFNFVYRPNVPGVATMYSDEILASERFDDVHALLIHNMPLRGSSPTK
ncbi:unnamed protein product, partial [Meganyctiphanes norvegica]